MIDKALKASTQEHLDIYTIIDHMVILKDGSVAMVLQTSAINFMLLSEEEQDATIYAYASLLNSLSFPIQILIRSTRKDISSYLDLLDEKLEATQSQKIKEQLVKYRAFVKDLVKENKVLEKRFYVVVPYSSLELGLKPQQLNPLAKAPQKPPYEQDYILNKAKMVLYPRRDHLIRQFARIGLKVRQLDTHELVALFYQVYNADTGDSQTFTFAEAPETEVPVGPEAQIGVGAGPAGGPPLDASVPAGAIPTTPVPTPVATTIPQATTIPAAPAALTTPASPPTPLPVTPTPVVQPLSPAPVTTPTPVAPPPVAAAPQPF